MSLIPSGILAPSSKARSPSNLRSRQEGGVGREEKKEKEERKVGKEGVPSYDTSVQGHTKRRREGVPSYDESIQGHPPKKKKEEGEGTKKKREREKEREREGEREREKEGKETRKKGKDENRCSQLGASVQGHTKERSIPECYIQVSPKRQREKKGRVGGGRGLRSRQTPTSLERLEQASAAAATYAVPRWLAALTATVT